MIFNDVLEIRNGRNQKNVENPDGKYPIYGSGGIMGYADDYICEADTVIIGRKGNINNPIFVEEPFWNVDTAFGLSAKREVLLPRYLYYFCRNFDFERLNKAVTIPSLTKSDLLKIEIELPSMESQQKVVDKLSKIEQIIQMRKQELQRLDELIKARYVEMFYDKGYPVLKWNDVFNTTTGKQDSNAAVDGGAYPFFTCSKEVLRIDDYAFEEEALKENWSYRLFQYQLEDKLTYLQQQSLGGLTKYLTLKILGELEFIIPPKKQQDKFDLFIKQVDKSRAAVQKALDETQLLFDSLMQKYFG